MSIKDCLLNFEFDRLFIEELGWNREDRVQSVSVNDQLVSLRRIAEMRGEVVFVWDISGAFPNSATRKTVSRQLAVIAAEHILIFASKAENRITLCVHGKRGDKVGVSPDLTAYTERGVTHMVARIERLRFGFDEAENATALEVQRRARDLIADAVTKKFFTEFKKRRDKFVPFLAWIEDESKRDWYCSVLLNRLMFLYFLMEKDFLPHGKDFLKEGLKRNREANGKDTFYSHFLLPLSFAGLGAEPGQRGKFEDQFKGVLYLNGGLFAVHSVEEELGINRQAVEDGTLPDAARIPDEEFEKWFAYFDSYRWMLDEVNAENEGQINPSILGHIFEKYINQKQMGAYYTKEDITGYICRNTIIPRLFDMMAEESERTGDPRFKQAVLPLPVGPHPNLMNEGRGISGGEGIDRYVYPSVKQEEKLPTETDYEIAQRRKRYEGILADFDAGKIERIDDFITYNLDIEKLALDFVSNIQDAHVLHAFYFRCLQPITVLDPTCGSGAFLFAALKILYPLYNSCLSRMAHLVAKVDKAEPDIVNWGDRLHFDDLTIDKSTFADLVPTSGEKSKVLEDLRAEVARISLHPSAEYFIKKSIIVNNLFGVDIMEEAVEICKLRLFLTLIATVERDEAKKNLGVEPLPDIDFNILAGNTLVGYTSVADIDRLWQEVELGSSTLAFEKDHSRLKKLVGEYGKVLKAWSLQQLGEWNGAPISKEQVLKAAESVRPDLDEDLWRLYQTAGLALREVKLASGKSQSYELTQQEFTRTHEPLHWLLEFPGIEAAGGFDAVVGNPPYVSYTKPQGGGKPSIKSQYGLLGLKTMAANDLFAFCMERSIQVTKPTGRFGQIVPLSATSTQTMKPLAEFLDEHLVKAWNSYYSASDQPASLFTGVRHRLLISLGLVDGGGSRLRCSTRFIKWFQDERYVLFSEKLHYAVLPSSIERSFPKVGSQLEVELLRKLQDFESVAARLRDSGVAIFYHDAPVHWGKIFDFVPTYVVNGRDEAPSSHVKSLMVTTKEEQCAVIATLNSSLFYWFLWQYSNCRDLTKRDIGRCPLGFEEMSHDTKSKLQNLVGKLMLDLRANSRPYRRETEGAVTVFQSFYPAKSKRILDQIDEALAEHFGFPEGGLEFIINYDLKYRMGQPDEEDGD